MGIFIKGIIISLCCLCQFSCIHDDEAYEYVDLKPGDIVPNFSVVMNNGELFSTSSLKGNVSLIVFFHFFCPDCREELPVIQRVYNRFKDKKTVGVCCISREETASDIEAFWQENALTLSYSAQPDRTVYSLFSTERIPRVYVVKPDLKIYSAYSDSPVASYEELVADVLKCLGE